MHVSVPAVYMCVCVCVCVCVRGEQQRRGSHHGDGMLSTSAVSSRQILNELGDITHPETVAKQQHLPDRAVTHLPCISPLPRHRPSEVHLELNLQDNHMENVTAWSTDCM